MRFLSFSATLTQIFTEGLEKEVGVGDRTRVRHIGLQVDRNGERTDQTLSLIYIYFTFYLRKQGEFGRERV